MVYASSTKKCTLPSESCYEKVGNIHNPFIYEFLDGQQNIIFMIKGLDDSYFTITIIEQLINVGVRMCRKGAQNDVTIFNSLLSEVRVPIRHQPSCTFHGFRNFTKWHVVE